MSEEKKLTDDTEIDVGMIEKTLEIDDTIYVWLLKGSMWKTYNLQKILDLIHRLQIENERLTEENKNLLIKVWNYERPARTPLYSSESMVNCNLVTCYNENADLKSKNAELQKQVDELKARNMSEIIDLFNNETDRLIEKAHQQAVKDTAKEILTELDLFFKGTTFRKGYEFRKINEKLKEIAKSKGVEVE